MDEQIKSMLEQAQITPGGGTEACTLQLSFNVPGKKPYTDQMVFTKDQSVLDVIHGLRCLANRIQSKCVEKIGGKVLMQGNGQNSTAYYTWPKGTGQNSIAYRHQGGRD